MVRLFLRTLLIFFSLIALVPLSATNPPQVPPADSPAETLAGERAILAESYINQKLWLWQRHLKLQHWNIALRMCPPAELKPRTLGNIHWDADKRYAIIRVLGSRHYQMPFREMLDDMEFTVVHELIHLQLSSLPRSEASRSAEELAVNHIAEALLKLDRR